MAALTSGLAQPSEGIRVVEAAFARDPLGVARPNGHGSSITHVPSKSVSPDISLRSATVNPPIDETTFRAEFLRALQREKRRAERSKSPLSMAVFKAVSDSHASGRQVDRLLNCLGAAKRETDFLGHLDDDVIAVLLPDTNAPGLQRFLDRVSFTSDGLVPAASSATYPDQLFDQIAAERSSSAGPRPLQAQSLSTSREHGYALKRWLDIFGAIVALVVLSPLMLITALTIQLSSPGPIIFRQVRLGRGGVPFVMYKFRSMTANADDQIHRNFVSGLIKGAAQSAGDSDDRGPQYKMKSDPRITRIGRFLRKTSIDEVPQFFNVLRGDMSLVGPRPPVTYEAERYEAWHLRRVLEMRPGMTGIWQVEGRSKVSFDDMVRMDLQYLRTCSLRFDISILLRTLPVVISGVGAD